MLKKIAASALLAITLVAGPVRADESTPTRRFGGCSSGGFFCAGPSASISLVGWNFKQERFRLGLTPGFGYGVTFFANDWYQTGLAVYVSVLSQPDRPTVATPAVVLSFAEYVRLGLAVDVVERTATTPSGSEASFLFGFGFDFGRTHTSAKTENNVFGPEPPPPAPTPHPPAPVPVAIPPVPPSPTPN
jgi:hypothetical protein